MSEKAEAPGAQEAPLPGRFYQGQIRDAFERGGVLDLSRGDPRDWIKSIDELLGVGKLDRARFALERMREQAPDLQWPQTMLDLLLMMPDGDLQGARFTDNAKSDLQVVPRDGARTVIMSFCGHRHQLNMPLWLFQRWMSKLDASVVYLRDFGDMFYVGGVRSCGSFGATAERLRQVMGELGAHRVVCIGNSSGAFGAMLYGLELGADHVFGFSGAYNMTSDFNTYLNRNEAAVRLAETHADVRLDLRELYLGSARRPRAELFYGDKCWDDRIHAEHMAGVPGIELKPVQDYAGHGALPELIQRRQFDEVLARFVTATPGG